MFPALAQASMAWQQRSNSQHDCIAVRLFSGCVNEGADARIGVIVEEVSSKCQPSSAFPARMSYMISSWTLCRPDGRDLNSTLSSSSTAPIVNHRTYRFWEWCNRRTSWYCTLPSDCVSIRIVLIPEWMPDCGIAYPAFTSNKTRKAAAIWGKSSCPLGNSR